MRKMISFAIVAMLSLAILPMSVTAQKGSTPYWPTEGWRTSTPEEQGMDSEVLIEMLEYLCDEYSGIHSFLVVRNGYLVLEMYKHPYHADRQNITTSAAKSIVSTLIGIAIGDGTIASIDERMLDFFPEQSIANLDDDKAGLTIKHLLTMTAGIGIVDPTYSTRIQSILDLPMKYPPGTRFEYNTGAAHLLKAIIGKATGISTVDFAQQRLFDPLGISAWQWDVSAEGIPIELWLTSRDMAKIGYLYLSEGVWDEEQILPAEYVEQATSPHAANTPVWAMGWHYGYLWWVNPEDGAFAAVGSMTTWIAVFPELNIVVVTTGTGRNANPQVNAFQEYVIPSVRSAEPLPANPEAVAALKEMIETFTHP